MGTTQIPYAERNWNVTVGCTHSGMKGCDNDWAKDLHDMRHKAWLKGKKVPQQYSRPFGKIVLRPDRLDEPLHIRKPTRFFVCSMSDLFHPLVPFSFVDNVLARISFCQKHIFMIFTKRILRAEQYFKIIGNLDKKFKRGTVLWDLWRSCEDKKWPLPNLWFIVSCSTQKELDENAPILFQIPAVVLGVSLEPLIEEVNILPFSLNLGTKGCYQIKPPRLDWIIVGAESGRNRRPCNIKWVRKIVDDCQASKVATYVKQLDIDGRLITDHAKFPADLRKRELPK